MHPKRDFNKNEKRVVATDFARTRARTEWPGFRGFGVQFSLSHRLWKLMIKDHGVCRYMSTKNFR